jgi:hypothetical protein
MKAAMVAAVAMNLRRVMWKSVMGALYPHLWFGNKREVTDKWFKVQGSLNSEFGIPNSELPEP